MKYFTISPVHVSQDCNPGGHLITAGVKYLLGRSDPEAMFWDVPMYAYSQRTWELLRETADVVVMCGHPRVTASAAAHHYWDTDLWSRIETVIDRDGKRFIDAWAGSSFPLPMKSVDEMGRLIRGNSWVRKILRVESKSAVCITRDGLAQRVIQPSAAHAVKLPCSSWFARRFFGYDVLYDTERTHNLIIPSRSQGREGVCRKLMDKGEKMSEMNGLPTLVVVHSYQDLEWCRSHGMRSSDMMCVYNPRTLLGLYQKCDLLLSMRIHATIPALSLGCRVLHIGTDARLLTVDEFGIKSNRNGITDGMAFEFHRASVVPDESLAVSELRKVQDV